MKRMFISRNRRLSLFEAFIAILKSKISSKSVFFQKQCDGNIQRNSSMKRMFISRNRTFSLFEDFIALKYAQNELKNVISSTKMRWEYTTQF